MVPIVTFLLFISFVLISRGPTNSVLPGSTFMLIIILLSYIQQMNAGKEMAGIDG